jgi:hypothetical protein
LYTTRQRQRRQRAPLVVVFDYHPDPLAMLHVLSLVVGQAFAPPLVLPPPEGGAAI